MDYAEFEEQYNKELTERFIKKYRDLWEEFIDEEARERGVTD